MSLYLVAALAMWIVATVAFYVLSDGADGEDWLVAVAMGAAVAVLWPVTLIGVGVFLAARRIVRAVEERSS